MSICHTSMICRSNSRIIKTIPTIPTGTGSFFLFKHVHVQRKSACHCDTWRTSSTFLWRKWNAFPIFWLGWRLCFSVRIRIICRMWIICRLLSCHIRDKLPLRSRQIRDVGVNIISWSTPQDTPLVDDVVAFLAATTETHPASKDRRYKRRQGNFIDSDIGRGKQWECSILTQGEVPRYWLMEVRLSYSFTWCCELS